MRIAIGGFGHETNTFASISASYDTFGDWLGGGIPAGETMLDRVASSYPVHGFAAAARESGHIVSPLLHAFAPPANRVTRDAFEKIAAELLERLARSRADAVFLQLHGAMVAEHIDAADGEILRRVRECVGPDVPVIATFDLHGNVDPACLRMADGIVAYRTYPHVDYIETGRRAFALLDTRVAAGRALARSFRRIPFLMPLHRQTTQAEPCDRLYARLRAVEAASGYGAKLSFMAGFPPSDVPQCGPSVFGYGTDQDAVDQAVQEMHQAILDAEPQFDAALPDAAQAVASALETSASGRPVILADVQDNPGGGAAGDTTWIIRALLDAGADDALVGLVHDPAAADMAHRAGVGTCVDLALGGRGETTDAPLRGRFEVVALHEGPFALKGPMFAGSDLSLGRMALLRAAGVRIAVVSRRSFYIERECFRVLGADPEHCRIVAVKSTNHYRADFASIARRIIEFAAPAAVLMNPASYPYSKLPQTMRLFGGGPTVGGRRG